ncbi:HNH endonuclease [Caulobacter virus Karma]|uniref:DNA-binding domain protein n=6 Tax=Viruses TaxID=10239 RepID=J3SVS5_9CAUD|nr:putative DNA-binding domain protein [Caulobacter phage phiCbK]YP_006988851.1 HNH endonuclease [Caulobacter virus Magneto]YP_006989553.1 HNH endonuclease [Caulobacter virus Karma]YP_006989901.1 HNH endonuclease [Caulobacter phage CcrSwift]ARB13697.1 HNH family endonuclease [Caulobacter phage Ccr10]ARB14042.1 HNH family endonuclease [Caulobacter phage Ccr2]ARB14385.1 HNH family endonuclease [Caulobacter phage Ccr5]ARB14729.1 homing endonuclease [Caulobacter phage Ccr29]ARB15084.1 homing en
MSGDAEFSIPVDFLRARYKYDPATGAITVRGSKSRKRCGSVTKDGYRVMKVSYGGRRIQIAAHKVAWAIHHGVMPDHDVDHKDLNRRNNRIKNLRKATRSQNLVNRPNVGALPKGVTKSRSKTKPFQAQVTINGVYRYLGCYTTPDEAHAAYLKHALPAWGEFLRVA